MRIRWRGLELPTRVVSDQEVSTPTYSRFMVEPFERGLGTTIGNSLRRVLLSSIEGAAVTSVKISGAAHEFQSMPGVMEDVTDIILNVKSLIVKMHTAGSKRMVVRSTVKGSVTADMIEADPAIEVINRDLVLATLSDNVDFEMEMTVDSGRGYVPAAELMPEEAEQEIGVIHVDASFSPVTRVRYQTEATRVGQKTNYDRLILEVWTNGTVTPEMAMVEAGKILRKHLNPFVQYFDLGAELPSGPPAEQTSQADQELAEKLAMPIEDLDLSVRASNCLQSAEVNTVGDLVKMNEADLLKVRSFGKTSLREIKRKLADIGLTLGLNVNLPESAASVSYDDDEIGTEDEEE
ncbi:MAG: DNA-directed RNA polymerase subunit alpha [Planctomycetota bacterium]